MVFKLFKKANAKSEAGWRRRWTSQGVVITHSNSGEELDDPLLPGYLAQLQDDGHAVETEAGFIIDWDSLFEALADTAYNELPLVLRLPPQTQKRPVLCSSNSLTDENFSIALAGWDDNGRTRSQIDMIGAVLAWGSNAELMQAEHWRLTSEVFAFSKRAADQRDDLTHRQWWGRIRKLALAANARMDDFLRRSVVLTPEKLEIRLRKSTVVDDDNIIEIEPCFQGAPEDWLERFDSSRDVLNRYDIVTADGILQVLITPKVKSVLQEIKRLPLRRVAGARAQAFILNPFATLGEDAKDVIIEEQFEQAREDAGLQYEIFIPVVERDSIGYPHRIGLLIETASATGPSSSETRWLADNDLASFVRKLEISLERGFQLLGWEGYDFELQGNAQEHLNTLKTVLDERSHPPVMVTYAQIHDLSLYSSRIERIGIEKPYYSPYIAKKKEGDGWFPGNVVPLITYTPKGDKEPIVFPATQDVLDGIETAINTARKTDHDIIKVTGLPEPMPLDEAENIVKTFKTALIDIGSHKFDPEKQTIKHNEKPVTRKSLVLRANIQSVEYEEKRREALQSPPINPEFPGNLCREYSLLPHQQEGVAWLQHLYKEHMKHQVRGSILADDIGLGKTLQLLTFMAWLIQRDPLVDPMLVVAPVSLLENWKEEADKFFLAGTMPILTAYGDSLAPLRLPRESIDARLRLEDGLVRFLKPNWIGSSKIVLTTYETLRDLEFSFAAQRWSVMVCDEAQRIKNPAAMVTRAAKKQNVTFKIACTGTPVENTLADLWCLFDFVQPGLLGALDDFGRRYRKPIEAKTDEDKIRVEELRSRIAPQILRRTKAEVAKDLPRKIIFNGCWSLPISSTQRILYAKAIDDFKKRNDPNCISPFKNHLGLLHYLRLICTDPKRHGLTAFKPEPLTDYRDKSPKMDWLLKHLASIQKKDEKAIIFCEFREIQRLLQYYIEEVFDFRPSIINGDTSAAANHALSRQKQIRKFQEKPGFGVIILSPVAVGFGVNIQAANHVIHYTRTWNPAKEDQATDRAYRLGQTKDVYVYYPVVRADDFHTFDVKLDELLTFKRSLAGDMLNGSGDLTPNDFDIKDIVPSASAEDIDERVTIDHALRMDWRYFEGLVAAIWIKRGFELCYCTPKSNDHGVDIVAIKGQSGELVQVKTSSNEGARLGWETVKDVVGGEAFYRRRHPNVEFKKVGLTNQYFNSPALEQAELNNVKLLDQSNLSKLLQKYSVTMLDIEQMLYKEL